MRDFTLFVTTHRQELCLIPALKRTDPITGESWPARELTALARDCDDTEAGAIGIHTEPSLFGTSNDDMHAISELVTTPILSLGLARNPFQIHRARFYGADAVLVWAHIADQSSIEKLITTAQSLHIVPVLMAQNDDELSRALETPARVIGLSSPGGLFDAENVTKLSKQIPHQKTTISLDEINSDAEASTLLGSVDSAVVGKCVLDASDMNSAFSKILSH